MGLDGHLGFEKEFNGGPFASVFDFFSNKCFFNMPIRHFFNFLKVIILGFSNEI